MLANHVVELLQATVAEGKVTWPGPIALELVAEAEAHWQPEGSYLGLWAQPPDVSLQRLPLVIENRSRFDLVDRPANDLQILLTVSNSATLFLDSHLNVKRFTPKVRELFNILPSDQGQPLAHLAGRLGFAQLVDDALEVLRSLVHLEREINHARDQWYLARLLPYRTVAGKIDGILITFLDITRLKETEAKLLQSQQQTQLLNEKLEIMMAEQTERVRRLASEVLITEQKVQESVSQLLHDELQQILFSIQMQMEVLHQQLPAGEQALHVQMRELRATTDLAFDVTRQVALDLRPPILLNEDFMESLHWLAATMAKRYGLKVTLKGTLRPHWPGQEVSILLFQTVRELLFNVAKHAGVKEAQVEVAEEASNLRLMVEVSDKGDGFDVATVMAQRPERGGIGLVNIRNRLELLGGQFHIESQPGRGTRATIVVLV